jgi:hypothetical protein
MAGQEAEVALDRPLGNGGGRPQGKKAIFQAPYLQARRPEGHGGLHEICNNRPRRCGYERRVALQAA